MNTTISNNGLPLLPQAPGQSGGNAGNVSGNAAADTGNRAAKAEDSVKLTDSARALQDAARVDDSAVIDTKRVEALRQSIADGSYKVDASRIADRMLALDSQLGGAPASTPKP